MPRSAGKLCQRKWAACCHIFLLLSGTGIVSAAPPWSKALQDSSSQQQILPQALRSDAVQEWHASALEPSLSLTAPAEGNSSPRPGKAPQTTWQWLESLWPFGRNISRRPGYRWDAYLFRNEDSFGEQAAEQAAKDALQQQEAADLAREQDDSMSMSLLPLPLRSVAKGSSARHAGQRLGDRETMAALQRLAVQEGVASLGDEPWTKYNESTLTPLIPTTVMWLVAEAEALLRNTTRFDLGLALDLSRMQSVAYCHFPNVAAWNCTRCSGRAAGFEPERIVYDEGWDLFGYAGWSPRLRAMVVSFRGTDSHSIYNWAENMRYWRTDFNVPFPGSDGSLVHTGFYVSYNNSSLEPNITASVRKMAAAHPGTPLYVIGHSMGAALATICAMDVKFKAGLSDVRLYTFGSPRVGNDVFASFVANQTTAHWRFTHNRDIVPSWPPTWVGFHHLPREVWQVDFGAAGVLGVCDGSGEDPRCHNSVCYLGLCTSVSDHLLYLGAHMYNGIPSC